MAVQQPTETNAVGETLGGYVLERKLAEGGMAAVYAARHALLGRAAAVKLISERFSGDEEMLSRFFYEARIVNKLRHPNIVDIFDFIRSEQPRRVACIMELLDGPSLRALLAAQRLPPVAALNLGVQLCDALRAVHAIGVIHRDLKPENIIVVGAPGSTYAAVPSLKLLDFGIAKVRDPAAEHHTQTGMVLGTPSYMAPEQITGGEISPAADVYAAAEIIAEMLTGKRCYSGETGAVLSAKLAGQMPDLGRLWRIEGLGRVAELITRGISKSPEHRPTIAQLHAELVATVALMASPVVSRAEAPQLADPAVPTRADVAQVPVDTWAPAPAPEPTPSKPETTGSPLPTPSISARLAARPEASITPIAPLRTAALNAIPEHSYKAKVTYGSAALVGVAVLVFGGYFAFTSKKQGQRVAAQQKVAQAKAARKEKALDSLAERWSAELGPAKEAVSAADARALHLRDGWAEYAGADAAYKRLFIDGSDDRAALVAWVENLAIWKAGALTEKELALAREVLGLVGKAAPPALIARAEAALTLATGDVKAARRMADQLVLANPKDGEAHLIWASTFVDTKPAVALAEAEEALKETPGLQRADIVRARALAGLGRYRQAMKLVEARLAKHPNDGHVLLLYADLQRQVGHLTRARNICEKALEADGDRVLARLQAGGLFLALRDARAAEAAFQAVVDDEAASPPQKLRAQVGLARAKLMGGTPAAELPTLEAAFGDPALGSFARIIEAERCMGRGEEARAGELTTAALEVQPESAAFVLQARLASGTASKVEAYNRAVANAPYDVEVRVAYAGALAFAGGGASSLSTMRQLVKLDPFERPDDPAHDLAAVPPAPLREATDRIRDLAKSARDPKQRAEAFATLAILDDREGRTAPAKESLAKALKEHHASSLALWLDAKVAFEQGDLGRADASTAAWAKSDPGNAIAHLMRARVLLKRGQKVPAKQEYDIALRIDGSLRLARLEATALDAKPEGEGRKKLVELAEKLPKVPSARAILFEVGL